MAMSEHISNLITAYKAMPNGERRNKVVSHLKDAEAHAKLLEQEDLNYRSAAEEASIDANAPNPCTCPASGVVRSTCPVHGK